jgi:hypothetical protein
VIDRYKSGLVEFIASVVRHIRPLRVPSRTWRELIQQDIWEIEPLLCPGPAPGNDSVSAPTGDPASGPKLCACEDPFLTGPGHRENRNQAFARLLSTASQIPPNGNGRQSPAICPKSQPFRKAPRGGGQVTKILFVFASLRRDVLERGPQGWFFGPGQ